MDGFRCALGKEQAWHRRHAIRSRGIYRSTHTDGYSRLCQDQRTATVYSGYVAQNDQGWDLGNHLTTSSSGLVDAANTQQIEARCMAACLQLLATGAGDFTLRAGRAPSLPR
jgi:hypothetical protein